MKVQLVLQIVHISGTRTIEAEIDVLSREKNMEGGMRGLDPLPLFPLGKCATARLDNIESWLRSWWGEMLTPLETMGWFEKEQRG